MQVVGWPKNSIKVPKKTIKTKKQPKVLGEENNSSLPGLNEFSDFETKMEMGRLTLAIPIKTISEANCFEPWPTRHKRHKAQKRAVFFAILPFKNKIPKICTLHFIRYGPKFLDAHDNLRMALKYIVDQTCAEIMNDQRPGKADEGNNFKFEYGQIKCRQYGVKIIIEF